jgi:hypothetical protein
MVEDDDGGGKTPGPLAAALLASVAVGDVGTVVIACFNSNSTRMP